MIETSMRGTRLGALSLERDDTVPPAERVTVNYVCPSGHESLIPISVEAEEIPIEWVCRCGSVAVRPNFEVPDKVPDRPVRSHWDMLLERRSLEELKALYDERVALLHEGTFAKSA
ncbi:MAG: RNA polymerase-binding protein RbpA [Actinomycetia bacterium]|nr:RNA polymerase-binding protein RbpA [Actinomycetes bacterium]